MRHSVMTSLSLSCTQFGLSRVTNVILSIIVSWMVSAIGPNLFWIARELSLKHFGLSSLQLTSVRHNAYITSRTADQETANDILSYLWLLRHDLWKFLLCIIGCQVLFSGRCYAPMAIHASNPKAERNSVLPQMSRTKAIWIWGKLYSFAYAFVFPDALLNVWYILLTACL